ncbi:MAG: sodium:dicarboxylate symporter [Firmicutes bacterium]|nr:sodium:dicarboxylate symporter [Bacillota bacterium]
MSITNVKSANNGTSNKFPLWLKIIVGLIIGVIIGMLWPQFGSSLKFFGDAFIKAIKMIVIPLVFSAVTLGIYKMGTDIKGLGRLGFLAMGWFYFATGATMVLGIGLNMIFHPGRGVDLQATGVVPKNLATSIDWTKFFLDIIPDNVPMAMANQKIIPVLFFAILFALALAKIGKKAQPIVNGLEAILDSMFVLTRWIVGTAPVAVAGIMAWVFATQGGAVITAMAKLIGVLYIGLGVIVIAFMIIVSLLGMNPIKMIKMVSEPLLLAFTTCSAEVTLPSLMQILKRNGISDKVVSFVLPLGYSFNLDGAALYQSLAVCFLAEAYGLNLDAPTIVTILITTLIANKGTAAVPAASLVVLSIILTSIGLPVEAIAILAGVDRFMDMGRTAVNVLGNTVATLLLAKFGNVVEEDVEVKESFVS